MTIKTQLRALLVVVGVIFASMFGIIAQSNRVTEQYQAKGLKMTQVMKEFFEFNIAASDYLRKHHDRALYQMDIKIKSISEQLGTISFKRAEHKAVLTYMHQELERANHVFLQLKDSHANFHEKYGVEITERVDFFAHQEIEDLSLNLSVSSLALVNSANRLIASLVENQSKDLSFYDRIFMGEILVSFVLLSLSIYLFSRRLIFSVNALKDGAARVAMGDLSSRIELTGNDELTDLTRSLNEMSLKLQESYEKLEDEIEERKRTEESLLESKRQMNKINRSLQESEKNLQEISHYTRGLIEASIDPLVTIHHDGSITDVNTATEKVTGVPRESLIGSDFCNYFTDPDKARAGYREVFDQEKVIDYPLSIRHVSGTVTDVLYNASVYRDQEGEVVGVFAAARDITRLKRSEEEIRELNSTLEQKIINITEVNAKLQEATREMESFTYSVSHDLRAPLRHISGFVELLERRDISGLDGKSRHYLKVISDATHKMGCLIDDLLSFSRMGRGEMMKSSVDLKQLTLEVIEEISKDHLPAGRKIKWRTGELPVTTGDPAMLRLALLNLISNAVKYSKHVESPVIEVDVLPPENGSHIMYVRDNGAGFDMKYVDKLFGLFQRLHSSEEYEGTGVGLASVRRIIHRHGGRTWAEGMLNEGATFYFSLPKRKENESW